MCRRIGDRPGRGVSRTPPPQKKRGGGAIGKISRSFTLNKIEIWPNIGGVRPPRWASCVPGPSLVVFFCPSPLYCVCVGGGGGGGRVSQICAPPPPSKRLVINYGEGWGVLQNGKIAGPKLFAPPPPFKGWKLFAPPPPSQ